jgi:GTP-binding nuclear protein Ran
LIPDSRLQRSGKRLRGISPDQSLGLYRMDPSPRFKLILLGDGGTGKSSFLRRHVTGEFEKKYVPTFPYQYIFDIKFSTNYGDIIFNIWESGGAERFGFLRDDQA